MPLLAACDTFLRMACSQWWAPLYTAGPMQCKVTPEITAVVRIVRLCRDCAVARLVRAICAPRLLLHFRQNLDAHGNRPVDDRVFRPVLSILSANRSWSANVRIDGFAAYCASRYMR
jgi:hypothetical protein